MFSKIYFILIAIIVCNSNGDVFEFFVTKDQNYNIGNLNVDDTLNIHFSLEFDTYCEIKYDSTDIQESLELEKIIGHFKVENECLPIGSTLEFQLPIQNLGVGMYEIVIKVNMPQSDTGLLVFTSKIFLEISENQTLGIVFRDDKMRVNSKKFLINGKKPESNIRGNRNFIIEYIEK